MKNRKYIKLTVSLPWFHKFASRPCFPMLIYYTEVKRWWRHDYTHSSLNIFFLSNSFNELFLFPFCLQIHCVLRQSQLSSDVYLKINIFVLYWLIFKQKITLNCELLDNFYFDIPVCNAYLMFYSNVIVLFLIFMNITPASPDIKIMHSYNI